MRKLFICESPYQIIVSLYIIQQFSNKNYQLDIIITNNLSDYLNVINNLKKCGLFDEVFFAKIKNFSMNKYLRKLKKFHYILHPQKIMKGVFGKNIPYYDEIYYWSSDFFTQSIRSYYALHKKNVKAFVFEEGYISYLPFKDICIKGLDIKIIQLRNKFRKIPQININNINGLLLFEPNLLLYEPACPVYKINRNIGSNYKFRQNIIKIFNAEEKAKNYDKKYIIFEEADYANTNIDDEQIFDDIINIVGKENVIVKLHPRTREDRFSKKGIKTLGNDGVPWEALSFAKDFSTNILITISSGSILNYKLFFGKKMTGFMLFKMMNLNTQNINKKYDKFWEKIEDVSTKNGLHIPKTKLDFYKSLDETKKVLKD